MPAFNFQPQWAGAELDGARQAAGDAASGITKRTTIRKAGRAAPGQELYLYTGQRTKACRKLGEALCLAVTPVWQGEFRNALVLGGYIIAGEALERLARLDTAGLWGADDLLRFLDETYPQGQELALYCW